jgi:hypothetical protein
MPPAAALLQIISSVAEHHSNLVPWQLIAQRTGAVIKHVRLTEDNEQLDMQVGSGVGSTAGLPLTRMPADVDADAACMRAQPAAVAAHIHITAR